MKNFLNLIVMLVLSATVFGQQSFKGCSAQVGAKPENYFQLYNSSGNAQLDNFVAKEVQVLRIFFEVQPSFFFYNDTGAPNARAMPAVQVDAYPSGTIVFGLNFMANEFNYSRSGTTIPLIMAHEFAHIVDYEMGVTKGYSTKTAELFADFQAGCFLFFRSTLTYTDIQAVLRNFYSKGDYEFNNSDHHGTPQERLNALTAGYNWLQSVSSPGVYVSQEDAIEAAKNYLGIAGFSTSAGGEYSAADDILENITTVTRFLTPQTDGNVTSYTYSVRVTNNNDFDVYAIVGGLVYGYYKNCNADSYNFEEEDEFEEQGVSVSAYSSATVQFTIRMQENPPFYCSGVKSNQQAYVIDAEKE